MSGRHTSGGLNANSEHDATWEARAARRRWKGGAAQNLTTLGEHGGCWCGEPYDHEWPGKADGEPHPH